jgi:CheY-like chemotaxis protein
MKSLSRFTTILLVEDDNVIRMLVNEYLEEFGYRVVVVASGDDALPILVNNKEIDLLITDVRMPGKLNGFDLIEEASRLRLTLKTIVMSGHTGETNNRADVADRFIAKPFTVNNLGIAIESLLGLRNAA